MKTSVIATTLSLVLGLAACSEQKTTEQYIELGQQLNAEKQYEQAIVELKNAVIAAPQNADVRYLLGLAYKEQGSYINAEKEFERAIALGRDNVITELSFVKMKLRKTDEVFQLVTDGASLSDDQYILLLVNAGIAALQAEQIEQSQDYFGQAISVNEAVTYGRLAQAYLAQTQENYQQSLDIVEQLLTDQPSISEPLLLKGNLLFALGQYQRAADTFKEYSQRHPQEIYIKYFRIESLVKAKDFKLAEQELDQLLAQVKDAPLGYQYKAQLAFRRKDFEQAKQYGERTIQYGDQFLTAKMITGVSAYQLGDIEQAYFQLRALERYVNANHPVKKILAIVKLKLGYADEALATLKDIDASDSEFLQLSSMELLKKGDRDTALSLLAQAEQAAPDNAAIKVQKGIIMLDKNDDTGIQALEQALEIQPDMIEVESVLAMEYLASNQDDKAQEIINSQTAAKKATGFLLQGILYSKQQQHEQAKASFEKALELEEENVAALFNLGMYAELDSDSNTALALYKQVINLSPNHAKALDHFGKLMLANEQSTEAIEFLETNRSFDGEKNNLIYTTAEIFSLQGKSGQAIELLQGHVNNSSETKAPIIFVSLGDLLRKEGKLAESLAVYEQGLVSFSFDYTLHLRLIGVLNMAKKFADGTKAVARALALFPKDLRLSILQAQMSFGSKQYQVARAQINKLRTNNVEHELVEFLSGHFAMMDKNYSSAIEYYNKAYELKSDSKNTLSLARALKFNGQKQQSIAVLEDFLSKQSNDYTVRLMLAELFAQDNDKRAIEQYQILVEQQPNHIGLLNNLAWNQYLAGDFNAALNNIETAVTLEPESKPLLETYGVILMSANKQEQAIRVLQHAMAEGSSDTLAMLLLAEGYLANGDKVNAKSALNAIKQVEQQYQSRYQSLKTELL